MSSREDPMRKTATPPPYAAPPGYGMPGVPPGVPPGFPPSFAGAPTRSGRAVAALVCATASYFSIPVVLAVVALVLVPGAKREILASQGRLTGDGMVTAAKVLAWINIVGFLGVVLLAAASS